MLKFNDDENMLFHHISTSIQESNTSGYYPYWNLSFGEYYRSWHLSDDNMKHIAQAVLLRNKEGSVSEIVDEKKVQIHWVVEM